MIHDSLRYFEGNTAEIKIIFIFSGKNSSERYGRHEKCDTARGGYAYQWKFHKYQGVFRNQESGEDNQNHGTEKRHWTAVLRD